jgi:hypothetical protein
MPDTKMNSSKYYYFDVTDILEYSRFNSTLSGIQRVSLRIIGYLVEKYGSERIRLIAYHPTRRVVISADSSFLNARYTFEKNAFCDYFALDKHYYEFDEYLKRKYKNKNKRKFHRARLRFSNFVTRGKSLKKRRVLYDWFAHTEHGLRKVELVPGDTVVILGATWGFDEHLSFLKKERETKKIRIVQLVHDLIPLNTPEHVGDNFPDIFYRWLKFMSGC